MVILFIFSHSALSNEKIGILLGTFDPPHSGHLHIALVAMNEASLDKIIVIPNFDAPHKPNATDSSHRLLMTSLAFADHKNIIVP